MRIAIKIHGGDTIQEEVHPEFGVLDLKALIEDSTGIGISEMRILHKGRALRDDDTLEGAGVAEDAQLYVALHSGVSPSAELNASSFVPQPGQPPPGADDPLAGLLNSPIMQGMLDNPEVLRSMVQANPGMREVMDNNPELAQMLNDPSVLRQSLASARNPQLMREMMRNTDRAMSNIEAHPGGHNALRRMYQTVQAPLYDAAAPSTLGGADGSEQQHQQTPPPPATGGRVQCSLLAAAAAGVAVASVHHGSSPSSSDPSPSRIEDDYDIGEMLGNGHFATVHRGKSRLTGKEVAIKVVPKSKQTAESIRHEAAVLKRVSHHKRIASLEAVYETDDTFYIVMEYVSGGEVLDNLIEHGAMSEREAATLISELAGAVALLHAQGLAHADIKPENLLLTHDGHVKLVDFGLSCQFVGGERVDPNKPGADGLATGTAAYWAPEVFGSNRGPGLPNDVWSLGVITYLLLCAAHPFDDRGKADDVTLVENIIEKAPDFEGWPASEEAQQFVSMLLRKRIDERPTIEQLLQHPWIVRGGSDEEFDGSEIWQRDEKLRQFRQQTARLRAACFSVLVQQQAERSHSLRGLRKNSSERRRDDAEAGQRTLRRYDSMRGPMLETGMLRRAFNVFDRDGKGYVSTADLRRVLDGFGLGAQEGWINDGALRRVDSSDSSVFDDGAPGGGGGDDGGRRITYGSFVRMMSHTVKRVYDAGELVFVEGDPVSDFYCLLSGEVEIVKRTGFFSEEVLNTLRPGECFGENALLEGSRKRSVSIRCATPAEILTLSKEDFEAAFGSAQPETGFMRRRQTTEKTDKDDEELRKRIISFIRMVSYQQKRTLSMGEAVYSCGDTVDKFHILASGKLGVRGPAPTPLGTMQEAPETSGAHQPSPPPLQHRPVPPSSSSAEVKYGEILVGQGFGESALLSGKPKHSKTVTCEAKKCEVVEILGSDFLRLVERSRAVRRNFERLDLKRQKRNERVLQTETQGQARYRGSG